jgi:hypothetical protein
MASRDSHFRFSRLLVENGVCCGGSLSDRARADQLGVPPTARLRRSEFFRQTRFAFFFVNAHCAVYPAQSGKWYTEGTLKCVVLLSKTTSPARSLFFPTVMRSSL